MAGQDIVYERRPEVITTKVEKSTDHWFPARQLKNNICIRMTRTPFYGDNKKIIGVLALGIDVTEEKKHEKEVINFGEIAQIYLENIISHLPGSVYWKDRNGVYLGCNDFVVKMAGAKNRFDIIGKTDYELPWKDYADELKEIDESIMENNQSIEIEETPVFPDGTQMTMLTNKSPLRTKNGEIIGIIGVSLDITARKKAEIQLKEEKEKVELANKVKTEFIQNMEHDIRTPFSGIYSLAGLLKEIENDPQKKEYLEEISSCAKELLDYCNAIIDYSRLGLETSPLLSKKFDLKKLIESIVAMEIPSVTMKKLDLQMEYSNTPETIIGDQYRVQRILINLVSNAVKFTHHGYIKIITRTARRVDDKNVILQISIKDTGIGIPEDKKNYIYEKFTRLTPANKGVYKGSGLGLTVVKQLIEELNGEIEVIDNPEGGTIFICTFPFKLPLVSDTPSNHPI